MVYNRENVSKALAKIGARQDVPLSELVSFRVGGPAAFVLQPKNEEFFLRCTIRKQNTYSQ